MQGDETVEEMLARIFEDSDSILSEICGKDAYKIDCYICGKAFNSLMQIPPHVQSHPECRKRKIRDSSINKYLTHVCMLCEKIFKGEAELKEHVYRHTKVVDLHQCPACNKELYSLEELDAHFEKHILVKRNISSRQYRFQTKAASWKHLSLHCRPKRPGLPCKICGRFFASKVTLKEHMFLPNLCTTCGMVFSRQTELYSHISLQHPDDHPFYCIICSSRFQTEANFIKHALTHDAQLKE